MKKLLKDYFAVILGTGLGRGLSFVTSLILARSMGAHGFGVFSIFFTVMFLVFQLPATIDAVYVRYAKAEAERGIKEYIRAAFFIKGAIFLFLLFLAYPAGFFLALYVFKKPEILFHLIAAIIAGAFLSLFSTLSGIYQAQERFYISSILSALCYILVFLIIVVIMLSKIILNPLIVTAVYSLSSLIMGLFTINYLYNIAKPIFPINPYLLRNMMHFGKWLFAESFLYIVLQRLDVLFLARFTSYEELGIYSAAVRISMFASILTSSATTLFMPKGCESLKSTKRLKTYFRESGVVTLGLMLLIVILIILSPAMIRILFGEQYLNCLIPARILLLDTIFVLLYTPFSFLFYANGNSRQIFNFGIVKLFATVICLLIFVPRYGSTGAALSIAFSSLSGLVLAVIVSYKLIRE